MIAVKLNLEELIDWSPMVRYYYSQQYACRFAASIVVNDSMKSRHFKAMKEMIIGRGSAKWNSLGSDLKVNVSALPHEHVSFQFEMTDKILSIKSEDPSVHVHKFEQIGTKVFVEMETHVRMSRTIYLDVLTEFKAIKCSVDFEVDEDFSVFLRLYQRGNRLLLHVKVNRPLKAIEYSINNKNILMGVSENESEWLIHAPSSNPLASICIYTTENRTMKWTSEYLKNEKFLKTVS